MSDSKSFSYNGLTVRVAGADPAQLIWLEQFLTPSFTTAQDVEPDCTVTLGADDRSYDETLRRGPRADGRQVDCFVLDSGPVRLPLWASPTDERVIFDERFKTFYCIDPGGSQVRVLAGSRNLDARFALMRVVREFAMSSSQSRDRLVIHGAAFAVEDNGVIIAGPKRAGKTTFLIHCLQATEARFISNDRVVVSFAGTEPVLRGMPTIVTVRDQTLDLFPALQQPLLGGRYDYRRALGEEERDGAPAARLRSGRPFDLAPAQFCSLLQARMSGQSRVRALLFPRVTEETDGIQLRGLSAHAAQERLSGALFGIDSPQKTSQAFVLAPHDLGVDRASVEKLCLSLTTQVQCFECQLGRHAYQKATAMTDFLNHGPPR
jgi:hypothetical protein